MRHSSLNVSLSCSAVVRGNRSFYRGNRTFYLRNRSFSLQTYLWLLPSQSCSWFGQEFFSLRIFFPSFQLKWCELATNWDIFDGKGQKCCDSLPHKFFCWFLYRDIHTKRVLKKRHISASRLARKFLKVADYSLGKSFLGPFIFNSSKSYLSCWKHYLPTTLILPNYDKTTQIFLEISNLLKKMISRHCQWLKNFLKYNYKP